MVTVMVGRKSDTGTCRLLTTADDVTGEKYVEFPVPTKDSLLQPGEPFWANYVKGVVAHYKGGCGFIR